MAYNSTIRLKQKICISCGKPCYWFSNRRCKTCATIQDTHARITAAAVEEGGLGELIDKLDELVSKWVRYGVVNEHGFVQCYTCPTLFLPADGDAGHYITRACMYLRFDVSRNIRPQCRSCNRSKYGMAAEFGKNLELEMPGVTEILLEESTIIHKWGRDELRGLIYEYTNKVKRLNI